MGRVEFVLTVAGLLVVVIAVGGASHRYGFSAPLVLVALGIAASFVPFVPEIRLTADVALLGFLPPLLYSVALQTSLVDFNANRRPILLLSIGLTAFTAMGVAVVLHTVIPQIPWVAAFVVGAVVAPPDAVAATSIARRVGMPRRNVRILEGESLLNDATALVALRTALGATGGLSLLGIGADVALAAVGGVAVGLLYYVLVGWVRRVTTDSLVDTSVSLVTPFAAYASAELVHASGVIAVVVAGLMLGHRSPVLQTASSRIAERLNWRTFSFLLQNAVFLLIGLQARHIIQNVRAGGIAADFVLLACVVTLAAVIVLRLLYVFPARYLLDRPGPDAQTGEHPSWAYPLVVGWSGMRGVVTRAAAFVIPEGFVMRDLLVVVAMFVTVATLFLQGLTLPWLVRRLRLPGPDAREDALARASLFQQASAAGRGWLEQNKPEVDAHGTETSLMRRLEARDFGAWERVGNSDPDAETPSEAYARLRREMLRVERARVLEVRDSGRVPHEVIEDVLEALDVEESMLDDHTERHERLRRREHGQVTGRHGTVDLCEHLATDEPDPEPRTPGECEDCVALGERSWVHLRLCLACGHVGCCDSSPRRHATAHYHETAHPVIRSGQPGEHWRWCYVDDRLG
jgi:CPA1 family monovalent cation:H+ antiporter